MTTYVDSAVAQATSGTVTLSSMSITGSVRKCIAGVATTDTSITMDAATLGGVNLVEMSDSPVDAANCRTRAFYLDEASFPGGSTADLVLDTTHTGGQPAGTGAIYTGVETGDSLASSAEADTYNNNNSDVWTLAATPSGTGGLAISICGRQVQSGDAATATGDLAVRESIATDFAAGIALLDELDPAASSRDGSGDWGTNTRDTSAWMGTWEEGAAAATSLSSLTLLGVS